ncbi:hypothetical protein QQS21_003322 [Conoideocrella luteorostrata]|uniref:Phytanoyl-CoA dioxygenase n=1 Tax=Conoideocrella luteorostrata TaxID=1105319 RepID=A0AAJ0G0P5_9HYPO|nr:hypothetical protein QQS21_003322 [Conoideocrella luteorostrata]
MERHNGSTEIWPGTHNNDISTQEGAHGGGASGRIIESRLAEQREKHPPVQSVIENGSIVIRDLRLWHVGMPNYSHDVRIMLAMIHFAAWYRNPMKLELADDVRPVLEALSKAGKLGLQVPVGWVEREKATAGCLNRGFGNSYDFNQAK